MPKNGTPRSLVAKLPVEVRSEAEVDHGYTCPKTGHVVPLESLPTGTVLTGKYTLFSDKGKTLGKGRIEDLTPVDAGTADAQADSEDRA